MRSTAHHVVQVVASPVSMRPSEQLERIDGQGDSTSICSYHYDKIIISEEGIELREHDLGTSLLREFLLGD